MDRRPYVALALLGAALAVALLVEGPRAWLDEAVGSPLRAQVGDGGAQSGYRAPTLVFWAAVGGVLAWVAYDVLFQRLRVEADRAFFVALAPALLAGPLLHAALLVGALPQGPLRYAAADPLVYLTSALVAVVGLVLGRATGRPLVAPLTWGALVLVPVLFVLAPHFAPRGLGRAGLLVLLAIVPALVITWAYTRWRPGEGRAVVLAVVGAHALDGATTWMVLRDPFGMGFVGFGERNPVSEQLVGLSNGWPYFAIKLALPLVLLALVRHESGEERMRAFLLLAVFALGFGPGMSNLLQVMMG